MSVRTDLRHYKTSAAALTTSILLCSSSTTRKHIAGVFVFWGRLRAAFSEYLAKEAGADPGVAGFRDKALGGQVLTADQARTFLLSPTRRFFTHQVLQAHEVPVEHVATLEDEDQRYQEDGPYYHYVEVRVNPPGTTLSVFNESPSPQIAYGRLTFPDEDGTPRPLTFWRDSILGDLHKVGTQLVKAYPWNLDEAIWFVLTGEAP